MNNKQQLLNNQTIESDRLQMRCFRADDANDLFLINQDEKTVQFLFPPHERLEQSEKMLTNYYLQNPEEKYAIIYKETNRVIGVVEFRVKDYINSAEIGYTLHSEFWGQGIMTEALNVFLHLAFTTLELDSVYAQTDIQNKASLALLSRLNFHQDGILRKQTMLNGVLSDTVHFSLLKEEYK